MPNPEAFAEVEQIQAEIRATIQKLAETVATIIGMEDVNPDIVEGFIAQEVNQARNHVKRLRLKERILLDQAAAALMATARIDRRPVWSTTSVAAHETDPRRPDLIREAMLGQLVRLNVFLMLKEAPPHILLHKARAAARSGDRITAEAIKDITLQRLVSEGKPCPPHESPPDIPLPRRYMMLEELGVCYTDYSEELGGLLDALAALEEAWLEPEQRQARALVQAGKHQREPLDLHLWARGNELLQAVVERLGDI
ncbi:MAG: hypothetical protein ACUVX8_11125 [Candidatus Zipacnadales bacterium]